MKFKFKHLVAGTLACLTTLTPAIQCELFGQQSEQTTLESLLRKNPPASALSPRPLADAQVAGSIQQVAYVQDQPTTGGRLVPRPAATAPLSPARTGTAAVPLPAPIVSPVPKSVNSPTETGGRDVPIISARRPSGNIPNVPIIAAPLGSNITRSKLDTAIGSGLKPTQDVLAPTTPAPVLGSLPATIAPAVIAESGPQTTTRPVQSVTPNTPPTSAAPVAGPTSSTPTTTAARPAISPPAAGVSASATVATPTKPIPPKVQTPPPGTTPKPTTVSSQTAPTGDDEIQVSEISPDDLNQLMQAFGSSPKVPANSASATTKERVESIGSGAILAQPTATPIGSAASSLAGTATSAPQVVEPVYESYGLNLGYDRPQMPTQLPYDGYGTVSGASDYLFTELLYMARDGGDFTTSYIPQRESYGFEPGMRMTLGRRLDSIEGREIGFTVMETMTSHTSAMSPTNSLFTWLQPGAGYNPGNLSSFNNASFHHSFSKSHYYAGEYNRVSWNWDVMSTFIGLRYTGMDELYALHSVGATGLGAYRLRARNHMFGPQVGGTLHYDIGRKLSFSLGAKIAAYANFYQTDTEFANESVRLMDVKDSRADLAWGTELACFAHYRLTPRARIKGGYELWFYDRMATSEGQVTGFVSPFSGAVARNADEALFYGFSLGLELFR
jgi:hypothetical protein